MTTLIWLPEHPGQDGPVRCLKRQGTRWVSTPLTPGRDALAVVPASLYQWHRIKLPRLAPRQRAAAAASILEPTLMQDMERTVFQVQPVGPAGDTLVAVFDRDWARAAQQWLANRQQKVRQWVPETALLPRAPGSPTLFLRDGEWVLCQGPDHHVVLDHTPDDTAPALFRAAVESTTPALRECQIAGLPDPDEPAERHTPAAPLWLATQGVRARVLPGTDWLQPPGPTTPNLDPSPRAFGSRIAIDFRAWRLPLTLGLLALAAHGVGLGLQTVQWQNEMTQLTAEIAQSQQALSQQPQGRPHAGSAILAQHLARLADLGVVPPALKRLDYQDGELTAELDPARVNLDTLAARLPDIGGALVPGSKGERLLHLPKPTGSTP